MRAMEYEGYGLSDSGVPRTGKRALSYVITAIANFGSFRACSKDVSRWFRAR